MCGLIAVFGKEGIKDSKERKAYFIQALIADTFRGSDSTGIFSVSSGNNVDTYKKAMPGWDFVQMSPFQDKVGFLTNNRFLVGHNRAATKGAVTSENAHPFQHGHITGVHNGTLWGHRTLPGCTDFVVDSDALFYSMSVNGEKETIEQLDGAFALIWYNEEEKKLKMVRNEERPLAFATVKDSSTILVASEGKMLTWLAHRNGLQVDTLYNLKPGNLVTLDLDTLEYSLEEVKLHEKKQYDYLPARRSGVDDMLKQLGYKRGQEVYFTIDSFAPFNKSAAYGCIEGVSVHSPYDDVKIYGVSKAEFNKYAKYTLCKSTIVGTSKVGTTVYITLKGDVEDAGNNTPSLCINCGVAIHNKDDAMRVNEGHDVICNECADELLTSSKQGEAN